MPRDVEPEVGDLAGVTLFDVARATAAPRRRTRRSSARAASSPKRCAGSWCVAAAMSLSPVIRAIRRRGDAVLESELARHASRLADLTLDEIAAVEALARGIVAKLLHDPIMALKERSEPGSERTHAALLVDLLGLDPSLLDGE